MDDLNLIPDEYGRVTADVYDSEGEVVLYEANFPAKGISFGFCAGQFIRFNPYHRKYCILSEDEKVIYSNQLEELMIKYRQAIREFGEYGILHEYERQVSEIENKDGDEKS